MSLDEQHEELRDKRGGARIDIRDPRVSAVLSWVWTALGALALLIGVGMYNKLSNMNDTLLVAVSKLEAQGNQINDMRAEMSKQRDEMTALRSQVFMLEGKTLRGIQEATRGH
jgi:hypothetical protein